MKVRKEETTASVADAHRKLTPPSTSSSGAEGGEEKSGMCGVLGRLCGRSNSVSQVQQQDTPEEAEKLPDISEELLWKHTVDANALIMMAVAFFMWGYYA